MLGDNYISPDVNIVLSCSGYIIVILYIISRFSIWKNIKIDNIYDVNPLHQEAYNDLINSTKKKYNIKNIIHI